MLFNTRTYNADSITADKVIYAGPAHTFTTADLLQLARVYPKPTKDFAGVARPQIKRTKSVVTNATTGERHNAIVDISGSLPVGMADADIDAMLADIAAWINTADAKALFKSLDVNA